jgi:novobiocin biosynthesis protein NovU/D-mycarose 3-C-methyltransferase
VLNLGVTPLPNAFKRKDDWRPGHYPVELLACPKCGLGQLSAVVSPTVLYQDYPYVTSTSNTMQRHFESLWSNLTEACGKPPASIIEIGSNDGLCLEAMQKFGASQVLGIDPAINLATISHQRGVQTITAEFNHPTAVRAAAFIPNPDVVMARHVFCHIDDWKNFIRNLAIVCRSNTVVAIEVPYAGDTIKKTEWDQIYAEHLSYLTLKSVVALLEGSPFVLHRVIRYEIHGGALVLILRSKEHAATVHESVAKSLDEEKCSIDDWKDFATRSLDQMVALKILVADLRKQGKRVVGYGASAKSTVWINACKFKKSDIEAIYDCTPQKWYTFSPGTDIPIVHEGLFYVDAADYAIVWAWNFLEEIIEKNKKWVEGGGKFIVPVPTVRVI